MEELNPSLTSKYDVTKEIGRGGFSIVYEAINKVDKAKYAVKTIYKRYVSRKGWVNLQREIEILKAVKHPNILNLVEYFESAEQIDLVLEFMTGGELFEQIVQRGNFNEGDAILIIEQVLEGLKYLHNMGVAHRDLKPENLLCSLEDSRVVVADFGLAKNFGRGELLQTHCGTPSYAAPEVVRGDAVYDQAVDLWSVGVITYVLLAGFFPFYDEDNDDLREKIIAGSYEFMSPYWDMISADAKDFVSHLLVVDPTKRFNAEQALEHQWIKHANMEVEHVNLRDSVSNLQDTTRRMKDSGYY